MGKKIRADRATYDVWDCSIQSSVSSLYLERPRSFPRIDKLFQRQRKTLNLSDHHARFVRLDLSSITATGFVLIIQM